MYLNRAMIIGNLVRDPELRSLPSGVKVTTFSVATNRVWNDKDGNKQNATEYHNIVVFGRQAEIVNQYMRKGSSILVEGRLQTRSWEQDGVKKYRTEIVADRVQFGPRSGGGSSQSEREENQDQSTSSAPEVETIEYPDEIDPEEIPF